MSDNITFIIDNTFYPCNGGAFQSEVPLPPPRYSPAHLGLSLLITGSDNRVQPGLHPHAQDRYACCEVVFVVLLQIFIFLFAYIMIMVNKLQNQKKKLKKIKQEKEDSDVIHDYEKENA